MTKFFVKKSCTIVCTYFSVACRLDPKKSHFFILVRFWIFKTYVDSSGLSQNSAHFFATFRRFLKKAISCGATFGGGDYRGGGSLIPTNKGHMILDVRYSVCRTSKII